MARPYFWKYIDAIKYPGTSGVSGAQATMAMATQWDGTLLQNPRMRALYEQVMSGQEYDKELYEQLMAPITYDYWVTTAYGKKLLEEWHQADIKAQQDAIAKQKAEQARLRAEQEAKAREQAAALERQRQAAEKARKEAEFKLALDAMNQRANVKRTDEFVGEISETPEQAAQRKKKRVGYDATKVTGILGAAPTESKKLLGM
jgi:membrane-bound lytic murein transglycosylase